MIKSGLKYCLVTLLLVCSLTLAATNGDVIQFRSDSPQQYQVVKGDTLWDISGRFLEAPWLWPEVWQSNRQIVNPDLIYPGDIVELVFVEGRQMLSINTAQRESLSVVRLSPQVRRESLLSPIQAISLGDINHYLSRNRIVSEEELSNAPVIVGSEADRGYSTEGDIVYALGSWNSLVTSYDIVRPGKEFTNSLTELVIGVEAILVGSATMISQEGKQAALRIDNSTQEVGEGDLLVQKLVSSLKSNYFPKPPSFEVNGTVVDIDFGKSYGGAHDTIILDVGERDRIETGDLLTLQKADHNFKANKEKLSFIGEKYGRVLIYQVFRDYSLGFVLSSDQAIMLNDRAVTP